MATARKQIPKIPVISAELARQIDADLTEWFEYNQRDLVFRKTNDPYAIMVSEFMLQQTTVAAVEPYYVRFLKRFPTVHTLAVATEDEVMAYWAGLGYYRRARQLRLAAQTIVSEHEGEFPQTVAQLQALPGFGKYTAGAVLSSAFDMRAPVLEANTTRVFARLAGLDGMVGDSAYMRDLWGIADSLVAVSESPRIFNIGAMELGALVCRPVPYCEVCPVQEHCIAKRIGDPGGIPKARPRREKITLTVVSLVMKAADGKYLLRRIPKGEWHAGMWEFPSWRIDNSAPTPDDADRLAEKYLNAGEERFSPLGQFRYTVTHHSITAHVFRSDVTVEIGCDMGEFQYFAPAAISELAMGSAQRKILNRVLELDFQESV